jgi:serine/threonine-protein kinase
MNLYQLAAFEGGGEDPERVLSAWIDTADRALALDASDVRARDVSGYARFLRGLGRVRRGEEPGPDWDEAVVRLTRALELEPNYPWGHNDLAIVLRARAGYERGRGRDPRPAFAEAERHYREALRFDPAYLFALSNLGELHNEAAAYALGRGLDPGPDADRASEAGRQALALDPNFYAAFNQRALAELLRAEFLVATEGDPRHALGLARAELERSQAVNPSCDEAAQLRVQGHLLAAAHALRDGADPSDEIERGRRAVAPIARGAPCLDCRLLDARLDLLEAAWARRQGRPAVAVLDHALGRAREAAGLSASAESHRLLAQIYARLAEARPPAAHGAVEAGLAQAERALALDPALAGAHAARGELLVKRARAEREGAARTETAREARASFARALELDPLLRREYGALAGEAETLARGAADLTR